MFGGNSCVFYIVEIFRVSLGPLLGFCSPYNKDVLCELVQQSVLPRSASLGCVFFCPLRVEVSTLTMFSDTEGSFFLVVAFSISNRVMNALRGRFALSRRLIHLEIRFALSRVSFLILGHLESVLFYRGQNNRYTYVELF